MAQSALVAVESQINELKGCCHHQEECSTLSDLLEAACSTLQCWQSSGIHGTKVKAAGVPHPLQLRLLISL
jgi:hypothetical protein